MGERKKNHSPLRMKYIHKFENCRIGKGMFSHVYHRAGRKGERFVTSQQFFTREVKRKKVVRRDSERGFYNRDTDRSRQQRRCITKRNTFDPRKCVSLSLSLWLRALGIITTRRHKLQRDDRSGEKCTYTPRTLEGLSYL